MNCALCSKPVCLHGRQRVIQLAGSKVSVSKCHHCGAGGINGDPNVFCLPTYEGRVDFSSDVYSTVCPDCHNKYANSPIKNCKCGCAVEVEPVYAGFKLPYYEIVCSKCGAEVWAYCEQTVIDRWNEK